MDLRPSGGYAGPREAAIDPEADFAAFRNLELATARLADQWRGFGDRQRHVLEARTFSPHPASLRELGEELALSKQRIQQIEKSGRDQLSAAFEDGPLADLVSAVRAQIAPVISLNRLLTALPVLAGVLPSSSVPVWRVIEAEDRGYEIRDGWCAVPDIRTAQKATITKFQEQNAANKHTHLESLRAVATDMRRMTDSEAADWIDACGLVEFEGLIIQARASISDRAAATLFSNGEPMSAREMATRLGSDRSIRSLKNALGTDVRFTRVTQHLWALTAWDPKPYESIRALIAAEVDAAGGQIGFPDLVATLTAQFDAKRNSIAIYANAHPFVVDDGVVRRRRINEEQYETPTPWETPRLFRRDSEWAWRASVTHDHLRGSGSPIPLALARIIDLRPGGTVTLNSDAGDQVFSWGGLSPTVGSVRRLLGGLAEDEEVAFIFGDEGRFAIEKLPTASNRIEEVLSAAALRPQPSASPIQVLAKSVGQPADAQVIHLVAVLRARGDSDLAELLDGL